MKEMYFNRKHRAAKIVFLVLIVGPLAVLAFGGAVMYLWNAILPAVLGVSVISFWQAVGLLVLCKILFGSMGGGRKPWRRGGPPHHLKEKFMNMSDEEKAAFKEQWQKHWKDSSE